MPDSAPRSTTSAVRLMPRGAVNMMSNSAVRKGAATLFFTILARTRRPTTVVPFLMLSMARRSMRTDE